MKLKLWFSRGETTQLEKVVFQSDTASVPLTSIRGRDVGALCQQASGTFQWTHAVRALAVLIARAVLSSRWEVGEHTMQGEKGSLASSLDYACSKEPQWLAEMFGVLPNGGSLARRLIRRSNPERKRPGPVTLSWNTALCPAEEITLTIGTTEVNSASALKGLCEELERDAKIVSIAQQETRIIGHSRTHELPLLSRGVGGLNATPFCTADLMIALIDRAGEISSTNLVVDTRQELFSNVPELLLREKIRDLTIRRIVQQQSGALSLHNDFKEFRARSIADALECARRGGADVEQVTSSGVQLSFANPAASDEFTSAFYTAALARAPQESSVWWHLQHALWPLLRPEEERYRAALFPSMRRASYSCPGTSPFDLWSASFYNSLGAGTYLGSPVLFDSNFWLVGDVVACIHGSYHTMEAIGDLLTSFRSVEEFDEAALRSAMATPGISRIRITVAPGLSSRLRSLLVESSSQTERQQRLALH